MKLYVLGIDLAKSSFEVCGMSAQGKVLLRKCCNRKQLANFIQQQESCKIALEACASAHYWGRKFESMGHEVSLLPAQYVKPFVKRNKNDRADAEAIAEASLRPTMHFVAVKSVEQQDMQLRHRVRSRLIKARTALANEMRGFLAEYGVTIPKGISYIRSGIAARIEGEASADLSNKGLELIKELLEEFRVLDGKVKEQDKIITSQAKQHPVCKRLLEIAGVGPITASAVVAATGDATRFKNGRHFAASLGLVPGQHSTGGKPRLLGISKKGDKYIRKLLVLGAKAALRCVSKKVDRRSLWLNNLAKRIHVNKAAVAMANKNARIIWALMVNEESRYDPNHVPERYRLHA